VTAAQLTALVVLGALVESLSRGIACMAPDSDPALVLVAAQNNAAQTIAFLADA